MLNELRVLTEQQKWLTLGIYLMVAAFFVFILVMAWPARTGRALRAVIKERSGRIKDWHRELTLYQKLKELGALREPDETLNNIGYSLRRQDSGLNDAVRAMITQRKRWDPDGAIKLLQCEAAEADLQERINSLKS